MLRFGSTPVENPVFVLRDNPCVLLTECKDNNITKQNMGNLLEWISGDEDPDEYKDNVYNYYDGNESSDNDGGSGTFPFSNIELQKSRKYDCILVFDEGSRNKEWNYQQYMNENNGEIALQYDYLNLLDADDIEDRKNRFPHNGVDWVVNGGDMITIHDFNKNERKLVIKALKKLDIKCKSIHSLNRREKSLDKMASNTSNKDKKDKDKDNDKPKYRYYYVGISEERCRKWAHQIGYNLEIEPENALTYLSLHDENLAKATINNDDEEMRAVKSIFWRNVYVKYDMNVSPQIYKEYYGMYGYGGNKDNFGDDAYNDEYEPSLFTIRDRITLINDAVTQVNIILVSLCYDTNPLCSFLILFSGR